MKDHPTKKQRELLSFIEGFIVAHGYGPSYREIMHSVGYKSVSTVATHVDNLIKKGHLRKRDRSARSLEVCAGQPRGYVAPKTNNQAENWLIDAVDDHFTAAENRKPSSRAIDQLYVLVGALHILGFTSAAATAKARLVSLESTLQGTQIDDTV